MIVEGVLGDGVTSETSTFKSLESDCCFAGWLLTYGGSAMLNACIETASSATAICNLRMMEGVGGTGFVAKGVVHTIVYVDTGLQLFKFRVDEHFNPGVGPNPRSLINIALGRPASMHRNGGDDAFYQNTLCTIADNVKKTCCMQVHKTRSNANMAMRRLCSSLGANSWLCWPTLLLARPANMPANIAGAAIRAITTIIALKKQLRVLQQKLRLVPTQRQSLQNMCCTATTLFAKNSASNKGVDGRGKIVKPHLC